MGRAGPRADVGPGGEPEPSAAPDPRTARSERLRRRIVEAGWDGLLLGHLPNIRYLTGFTGSSALLLTLRDGGRYLLTDFRYEEQASEECPDDVASRIAVDGLFSELAALLDPVGPLRIGFEPERFTVRDRRELGERCGGVAWEDAPSWVERMRARKDPGEVARIREAAGVAERALEEALALVEEGMTEREIAAELECRLRRGGSGPLPFVPIVAAGPRSALPHAEPGPRPVAEGDLLLFDLGATAAGYCCDLTRTVVLGAAAPWQREIHEAVREAREAAVAALQTGRAGREVDRAARAALEARGRAERFGHSTGHGIGLEVHESPRLARRSEDTVEAGNVVTVEPGVYLPGRGGVRIEDDVLVEAGGPRVLTRFSRNLLEL